MAEWVFDPQPPSGMRAGGNPAEYSFEGRIDTLVRETVQNSLDARQSDDEPVEITFRLVDLSGRSLQSFKQAINWDSLIDNLEAVPSTRGGQAIERTLESIEESRSIRMLVIEDRKTLGLNGTEQRQDDESVNSFCALVRDVLYSDKSDEDAAGSFGLGKSVLWAYSGVKTVLFSSVPKQPPEGHSGLRFIGRAWLPYHETEDDGPCTGDGWFGIRRGIEEHERRAESIWGDTAARIAESSSCFREPEDFGLSAVVIGFTEPGEEDRNPKHIVRSIENAALESFWPAMAGNRLSVRVRYEHNGTIKSDAELDPLINDGYRPAVRLLRDYLDRALTEKEKLEPGESALVWVNIDVPEKTSVPVHHACVERVAVLVRLLQEDEISDLIKDKIFRFRRMGMVVRSSGGKSLSIGARPYVAAVLAGRASGIGEGFDRVERFLRAAEPPEHDRWTHNTRAIKNHYRAHGCRKKLADFEQSVISAVSALVSLPEERGGELPEALRKHLRFGERGGGGSPRFLAVTHQKAEIVEDSWHFRTRCRRIQPDENEWYVRIRLKYARDGGGGDDIHAINHVDCDEARRIEIRHGDAMIEFPSEVERATIHGTTDPNDLPTIGTRAAISLRVDGETGGIPDA